MFDLTGFCGGLTRRTEDEGNSLFSLAGCRHDEAFVAFQHLEPVLNICGVVAEALCRFQPGGVHKGRRANLCDKFLFAVSLAPEVGSSGNSVQPLGVSRAVNEFVEGCAVILCGFLELCQKGKCNGIVRGTVEGPVALLMVELYARSLQVVAYDALCLLVGFCTLGKGLAVLRFWFFAK